MAKVTKPCSSKNSIHCATALESAKSALFKAIILGLSPIICPNIGLREEIGRRASTNSITKSTYFKFSCT